MPGGLEDEQLTVCVVRCPLEGEELTAGLRELFLVLTPLGQCPVYSLLSGDIYLVGHPWQPFNASTSSTIAAFSWLTPIK